MGLAGLENTVLDALQSNGSVGEQTSFPARENTGMEETFSIEKVVSYIYHSAHIDRTS
jgi:hypothetical protein